jgi:hypothetical protein
LRLAPDITNERKRRLMRAARRIAKVDLGRQRVVGDDTSEQIGRNTADKSGLCIPKTLSELMT